MLTSFVILFNIPFTSDKTQYQSNYSWVTEAEPNPEPRCTFLPPSLAAIPLIGSTEGLLIRILPLSLLLPSQQDPWRASELFP